jgi:hypothetical protein
MLTLRREPAFLFLFVPCFDAPISLRAGQHALTLYSNFGCVRNLLIESQKSLIFPYVNVHFNKFTTLPDINGRGLSFCVLLHTILPM